MYYKVAEYGFYSLQDGELQVIATQEGILTKMEKKNVINASESSLVQMMTLQ